MDTGEPFFENQVDRTPYGACGVVGGIVLLIVGASIVGLWSLAGYIKRESRDWTLPNIKFTLPAAPTPSLPAASDLEEQGRNLVEQKKQEAIKQAEDAAKAEAERQITQQADNLRDRLPL